jgi:hypothetical protein
MTLLNSSPDLAEAAITSGNGWKPPQMTIMPLVNNGY